MDFPEKQAIILNALIERRGLQHIVNVASEVMGNPVFVYDISWRILARSNSRAEDEKTWALLSGRSHCKTNSIWFLRLHMRLGRT